MTYRSRYFSRFQLGAVLDLLVTDQSNPRSIAYQLVKCAAHAAQLPIEAVPIGRRAEEQLTMSLLQLVRRADCAELARAYLAGDIEPLEGLLSGIDSTMPKLSDAVSHRYFFHSGAAQRISPSLEVREQPSTGDSYITIAWGRDYGDVCPIPGRLRRRRRPQHGRER